jgi:nucleotide-binding universal stress UspA family protein
MMKILVATGGAPHSEKALQFTAELVQKTEGTVTIVTVVKQERLRPQGESILTRALTILPPHIYQSQTRLRIGHPAEEIVREAEQGQYNLIVVGEREQHDLVTRFILGSTAERVVAHAPCPVLIAKGQVGPLRRLLLCDSGISDPSLLSRLTHQLPRLLRQEEEVTVLHVMSQIGAAPGIPGSQLRATAEELITAHAPEGELLERDLAILQKYNITCRPKVRHGLVVDEIVAEARTDGYDLVVIGAHRDAGWQSLLLDDLSHQIITHVNRPILVVR